MVRNDPQVFAEIVEQALIDYFVGRRQQDRFLVFGRVEKAGLEEKIEPPGHLAEIAADDPVGPEKPDHLAVLVQGIGAGLFA